MKKIFGILSAFLIIGFIFCVSLGLIIPVSVDSVGSKTYANLYVVYFSTRYLTFEEKKSFMSIGRKNLNCIAWFQYRPELISEIIQYLPSQLADSLRAKHIEVQENMNKLERLYNKD
jgi:hypothetical protein